LSLVSGFFPWIFVVFNRTTNGILLWILTDDVGGEPTILPPAPTCVVTSDY